jgi:hypothetical protein
LAARISTLGAPPLFPADFFTKTIHLLAFSWGLGTQCLQQSRIAPL